MINITWNYKIPYISLSVNGRRFLPSLACVVIGALSFIALPCYGKAQEQAQSCATALQPDDEIVYTSTSAAPGDEDDEEDFEESDVVVSSPVIMHSYDVSVQKEVKEAEALYRKAIIQYEQGNTDKAKELFGQSLQALRAAHLDSYAFYQARAGFDGVFNGFHALFSIADSTSSTGKYSIPMDTENELVKKYLQLYTNGNCKATIRDALERSGKYRAMIHKILREYDVPEELVYLPVVESLYNVNDRSRAGAVGLWQFMPERAKDFGLKMNYWIDERKDPEKSTRAAAQYLRNLYFMFDNWHLALAAYNRGEYGLARDLQFSKATNISQISDRHAVPRETEYFVPQFIACTLIGDNYRKYCGEDIRYEAPAACDEVSISEIVDLGVVAKCANTSISVIRELNPALKAWCTPHNYPNFVLRIPAGTRAAFLTNIAQVKELNPSQGYIKYKIAKGDCLSRIAKKFGTSVSSLQEDNRIKNPKQLRVGQTLMIRPGRQYLTKKGE